MWGGGIYEADDFYDVCDELGLLTWQDFLFACAAYAEEEPLRGEVEAEARENIARIAHHASLVLLTGNNENLWATRTGAGSSASTARPGARTTTTTCFPRLIAASSHRTCRTPREARSAPAASHPNDERPRHDAHLGAVEPEGLAALPRHTPRFVAEFGWQGPPTWSTLTRAISDDPLTPESPGMIVHQKAIDGNVKLTDGLMPTTACPTDMETWHWAMQLNQANAVSRALEHFRSHAPHTSGAIVWQLNDCWPVTSWAAIDGDGRAKPLFYALRNASRRGWSRSSRAATASPRSSSTTPATSGRRARFARRGFDGVGRGPRAPADVRQRRAPRRQFRSGALGHGAGRRGELLLAELDDVRGLWFFAEPRDSALGLHESSVEVAPRLTASRSR